MTTELEAVSARIDSDIAECVRVYSLDEHELSDEELLAAARRLHHITDGIDRLPSNEKKVAMERVQMGLARIDAAREIQRKRTEDAWNSR